MTFVITSKCVSVCDTACVQACPVDAIAGPVPVEILQRVPRTERPAAFPGARMYIDPDTCICCGGCEPVCPASAIVADSDLTPEQQVDAAENARFFGRSP
jgi:NAD-dependent dihydropyrimidine dehydrogenase PreA subunit